MDLTKLQDNIRKERKNLELLLFGKGPKHKRLLRALINVCPDEEPYIGLGFTTKKEATKSIKIPIALIKALPGLFSLLPKYYGKVEYGLCHEVGEIAYLLPLFNHVGIDSLAELLKGKSFSIISASDVYGDLVASTFSPLEVEDQLYLLYGKDPSSYKTKLTEKEMEFIKTQAIVIGAYSSRIARGYQYGPELNDFYEKILKLQIGFDEAKRKEFQLKLYDSTQRMIEEKIREYGVVRPENIQQIIFDTEILFQHLKASLGSSYPQKKRNLYI